MVTANTSNIGKVNKTPVKEKKVSSPKAGLKTVVQKGTEGKLAIVLVRGFVDVTQSVKDTLDMLKLTRKNTCVVIQDTPIYRGMINKVKDYVTWGEIGEESFKELVAKRGIESEMRSHDRTKKYSYAVLEYNGKRYLPYFRLNPPRKGFGRKGIKIAFTVSGALGYRGAKMEDLVKRML